MFATILIGLPMAGKSSYARNIAELDKSIILSRDGMHKMCTGIDDKYLAYNTQLNPMITDMMNKLLKVASDNSRNIIIDNTNCDVDRLATLVTTLNTLCYDVRFIYMNTPVSECKRRVHEHVLVNEPMYRDFTAYDGMAERMCKVIDDMHPKLVDTIHYIKTIRKDYRLSTISYIDNRYDVVGDSQEPVVANIVSNPIVRDICKIIPAPNEIINLRNQSKEIHIFLGNTKCVYHDDKVSCSNITFIEYDYFPGIDTILEHRLLTNTVVLTIRHITLDQVKDICGASITPIFHMVGIDNFHVYKDLDKDHGCKVYAYIIKKETVYLVEDAIYDDSHVQQFFTH